MDRTSSDETYSEEETARRRDEALRRALSMPPKPHKVESEERKAAQKPARKPKAAKGK
jgi:hypothetical protein